MATLETLLQNAGFTEYEARAYVALLHKSPQTGYELAKTSRIPRANVYEVLHKLEARGAATRVVSADTIRYAAVESDTVLRRMKTSFADMMRNMEQQLSAISRFTQHGVVECFEGYENLLTLIDSHVAQTERELLLAVHPTDAARLEQAVDSACNRGVHVRTLCLHGCPQACVSCRGEFRRNPFAHETRARWLIAVVDGQSLVAGEIEDDRVTGFRSRLPLLAKMAEMYMTQSMLIDAWIERGQLNVDDIRLQTESLS